jgi:hypothetical protein
MYGETPHAQEEGKMNTAEMKATLAQMIGLWNILQDHATSVGMTKEQADAFATTEMNKLVDTSRMLQEVK